jgi:hypothetical protein
MLATPEIAAVIRLIVPRSEMRNVFDPPSAS